MGIFSFSQEVGSSSSCMANPTWCQSIKAEYYLSSLNFTVPAWYISFFLSLIQSLILSFICSTSIYQVLTICQALL